MECGKIFIDDVSEIISQTPVSITDYSTDVTEDLLLTGELTRNDNNELIYSNDLLFNEGFYLYASETDEDDVIKITAKHNPEKGYVFEATYNYGELRFDSPFTVKKYHGKSGNDHLLGDGELLNHLRLAAFNLGGLLIKEKMEKMSEEDPYWWFIGVQPETAP